MSQVHTSQLQQTDSWSNDGLDRGIVDLYARRIAMVAAHNEQTRQDALDRIVVTRPFGRAFTAQPSFPPDPPELESRGLAGLRRKLAGSSSSTPRGKLATS